ncbi:hypothetical protein [Pseudomonas sp. ACN5]|uniref:hypothetical protein n=1 Tax=Pseudomonas sp. ACN5 TaxID=1920427 RepID=UPI00114438A0|nr:hypothetical protein [Pseudomonas sp. ACN5]
MATDREIALEQALVAVFDAASRGQCSAEVLLARATEMLVPNHPRYNWQNIDQTKSELSSAFATGMMG